MALGLPFNPELGLFNIFGDIRCQPPPDFADYPAIKLPGPWSSLTLDQMIVALRAYGAAAARKSSRPASTSACGIWGMKSSWASPVWPFRPVAGSCDDTAGGPDWYHPPDRVDPAIGQMTFQTVMQMPESRRIEWLARACLAV